MKRIIVKSFLEDAKNTGSIPSRRNKLIEAAPDTAVSASFPANRLAQTLHPKNFPIILKSCEIKDGFMCTEFVRADSDEPFYFKGGQYLGIRYSRNGRERFSALPVSGVSGEKLLMTAFTREYDGNAYEFFESGAESEILAVSFEGHMNFSGIRDRNGVVLLTDCYALPAALSFAKATEKLYESPPVEIYAEHNNAPDAISGGIKINKLTEKELPEVKGKTLFITGNYEFCEKYAALYEGGSILIKKYPVNTVRGYDCEAEHTVKVIYRDRVFELVGREGERLSDILLGGGVPADVRCADGECGYCRMRLLSGEVRTLILTGEKRTMADVKYGFIHPCSVTPVSDIALEL